MRNLTKILLAIVFIALVGFTFVVGDEKVVQPYVSEETSALGEEAIASDLSLVEYVDKGNLKASWYGPGFHGRKTANGEIYDQNSFTAAHKSYKFGTLLKVTNTKNNRSVVIRINDRGPYIPGRDLDLSKAAAQELKMVKRGVVRLKVEEIKIRGIDVP